MLTKIMKKNQVVIFVGVLMLMVAGYLSIGDNKNGNNLIPTSTLADTEEMASIGDAKLVSANIADNKITDENISNTGDSENKQNLQGTENTVDKESENVEEIYEQDSSEITEADDQTSETSSIAESQDKEKNNTEDNYFTQSKIDRDTMYSQTLETYQKIVDQDNISESQKSIAQKEITKINEQKNAIMIAENLIKVKGFEDLVIFVNGNNVSIIVKADKLEQKDIAQIQNIITRELNVQVENINISSK